MNKLAATKHELQQLLSDVAFTRGLGLSVRSIDYGKCVLDVPFQPEFERPGGIVSGQVYMAAADVAMWLAIKTRLGMKDQSVTTELKTIFLRAAKQEQLVCSATVLKLGKTLIYGTSDCRNAAGELLTHHTITYARRPSPS
ncbi:MAG TPA: PaaI family thioesterase [Blastocatellia bacterium]|nr:PaaI family thioesterase [Blastocatellia bacterium]